MSLRIALSLAEVTPSGEHATAAELVTGIATELVSVPVFADGAVPVILVLHSALWPLLNYSAAPVPGYASLVDYLLVRFKQRGLTGFVSDDDDELAEAKADEIVIRWLYEYRQAQRLAEWERLT